jgi:hypothetical protein
MNDTRERHLDGIVVITAAGGTVVESLAPPDLFTLTLSERTSLTAVEKTVMLPLTVFEFFSTLHSFF